MEYYVLGSPDPEMGIIEAILQQNELHYEYATQSGKRCHPGNAYRADNQIATETVVMVECAVPLIEGQSAVVIDHHRPGDPGFGLPPAEFWRASSLGQVYLRLQQAGLVPMEPPPKDLVLAAAADHCLGAAYRGECPGIDPDELMAWRAASRAAFQGRSEELVVQDVENTRAALRAAPWFGLAGLRDMRKDPPWPELPEAGAREGIGYVSGPLRAPDGKVKFTCSGSTAQVTAWMLWAEESGTLEHIYGDPARGFAGGYES